MTPDEVRKLDNKKCIVLIRGYDPVIDFKFNTFKHPMFKRSGDGGGKWYIHNPQNKKKPDTKEELEATEETLVTIGKRNSCQIEAHYLKQREALNTALPIGVRQVETMRTLMTQYLAVLMPFNVQELYLPGKGGTYYGVNQVSRNILFGNRKRLVNGNGFIFGVPGSGKSFFAKMEMGNVFLNTDDDIIVIDPQHEYFDIAKRFAVRW